MFVEEGQAQHLRLFGRQLGQGLLHAAFALIGEQQFVRRQVCIGRLLLGVPVVGRLHRAADVAPVVVDAQVARDRVEPGRHLCARRVETRGAPPQGHHRLLRQLLGQRLVGATAYEKTLDARCKVAEQRGEGRSVAGLGHGVHPGIDLFVGGHASFGRGGRYRRHVAED